RRKQAGIPAPAWGFRTARSWQPPCPPTSRRPREPSCAGGDCSTPPARAAGAQGLTRSDAMGWRRIAGRGLAGGVLSRRAAVDLEPLAGDEGGEVGGEEEDDAGDVFGGAHAAQGGAGEGGGLVFLGGVVREGKARGHDVDADAAGAGILREHGGEVDQAGLGGSVGGQAGGGAVAPSRRGEDEAAPGRRRAPAGQEGTGEEEGGGGVAGQG